MTLGLWSALTSIALAAGPLSTEGIDGPSHDVGFSDLDRPVGRVVGGDVVTHNDWPDAAGVVFNGSYVGCTGTLVHPRVVLTAGHCVGNITDVVLGSTNWLGNDGEIIAVERTYEYPSSQRSYDVAALVLAEEASYPPRPIARDCITDEYLADGAEVAVVGFGATRASGRGSTTVLHEGTTYIQDADGDASQLQGVWTGFQPSVSPGGELGAGGNGVDACFGDSGGPLYLVTPKGDYLIGITSRAYIGVDQDFPCRQGGVYVRADAIMRWAEKETGFNFGRPVCNTAPTAIADAIYAEAAGGTTQIIATDLDAFNEGFVFEVTEEPAFGSVEISAEGLVTYTADGRAQDDSFVVQVTDEGSPWRASGPLSTSLNIDVVGAPGCGGCDAGGGQLSWLGLVVLPWWRRRRAAT